MAQLLGISCNDAVEMRFSFKVPSSFTETAPDGWGYGFFNGEQWQIFKQSLDMEKILRIDTKTLTPHIITGKTFISHVRYATHGKVKYENTHPFERDLFNNTWVFAHHGHLRLYRHIIESNEFFKPEGETDSEAAFCTIMESIHGYGKQTRQKEYAKIIEKTANKLSKQGGLNFILSTGEFVYTFYSGYRALYHTTIRPPFKENIKGEDDQIRLEIRNKGKEQPITLISSQHFIPDLDWREMEQRKLKVFKNGVELRLTYN